MAQGLIALNLIDSEDQVGRYYMHSVSHFLGLDTHDLGGREAVLEEGNVITVEPGLYLPEENLGVHRRRRAGHKTGHKVLSAKIPKEIKDIEKLRRRVTVP